MAKDFRKAYYSQLGVQAVEVKNSLDSILQEDLIGKWNSPPMEDHGPSMSFILTCGLTLDLSSAEVDKISKLAMNYRIPSHYRPLIWKILLGNPPHLLPPYQWVFWVLTAPPHLPPWFSGCLPVCRETWEFVANEHREQYADVRRAAQFLFSNGVAWKQGLNPEQLVQLTLVAAGKYRWFAQEAFRREELPTLKALADVFLEYCEDEGDAFWIFERFLRGQDLLKQDFFEGSSRVYAQVNQLSRLLKAHDSEFFEALRLKGVELDEFAVRWFRSYFAESLSSSALERIFDLIIVGHPSIVVFVALCILLKFKSKILHMKTSHEVKQLLMLVSALGFRVPLFTFSSSSSSLISVLIQLPLL